METRRRLLKRKKSSLNSSTISTTTTQAAETQKEEPSSSSNSKESKVQVSEKPKPEFISTPNPDNTPESGVELRLNNSDHLDESPPILYSQAFNQEVYWDDNTPQMRKYRARLRNGLRDHSDDDISPVKFIPMKLSSTPNVKTPPKSKVLDLPSHDLIKAQEALNGIQELNKLFEQRKKEAVIKPKNTPVAKTGPSHSFSRASFSDTSQNDTKAFEGMEDTMFSDDDSTFLRCAQEAETILPATNDSVLTETELAVENPPPLSQASDMDAFESDDSFDMFLSQVDEEELTSNVSRKNNKENVSSGSGKREHATAAASSSSPSSRAIKKTRSSDDGLASMREKSVQNGGGVPLRRICSENKIQSYSGGAPVSKQLPCTQQQIEEKRLEAKRKRQRSQMSK